MRQSHIGVWLDCPIEPLDPLAGIAAAVRRVPRKSREHSIPVNLSPPLRPFVPSQPEQPEASGEETSRGYLAPRISGDFVILPSDPTIIPAHRLYDLRVLATFIDGAPVHLDPSLTCDDQTTNLV